MLPKLTGKGKKLWAIRNKTQKVKTIISKIFVIGSPERSIELIEEKMFLFPKQEGYVMRGGSYISHRSIRRKGLCLKRLRKIQGKFSFCDIQTVTLNSPSYLSSKVPLKQPEENNDRKKICHCSKLKKRFHPHTRHFKEFLHDLIQMRPVWEKGLTTFDSPHRIKGLLREKLPPEPLMLPRWVVTGLWAKINHTRVRRSKYPSSWSIWEVSRYWSTHRAGIPQLTFDPWHRHCQRAMNGEGSHTSSQVPASFMWLQHAGERNSLIWRWNSDLSGVSADNWLLIVFLYPFMLHMSTTNLLRFRH